MKTRILAAVLALAASPLLAETPNPSGRTTADVLAQLEQYAVPEMAKEGIPGMAYAVVKDGQVVFAKGYGRRSIADTTDNVTTGTLFEIGSATKSFTATLVGMLVDEGKLSWDDRVVDLLPSFKLHDPWVTHEFRVVDLMSQRSGMTPYSLDTMGMMGFGREQIVAEMEHVEPAFGFRNGFGYVNHLWITASQVVEKLDGRTYEEALAARIFQPLGMRETTADPQLAALAPDRASGHIVAADGTSLRPMPAEWPYRAWIDVMGPAGSIRSTVNDLASYVAMHVARGKAGTGRLLTESTALTLHAPRTTAIASMSGTAIAKSYALGWVHEELSLGTIVWHNGGTLGQHSILATYDGAQTGLVVLTNTAANLLPEKMRFLLYNLLYVPPGGPTAPLAVAGARALASRADSPRPARPLAPIPPLPLDRYVGIYENPAYGQFEVKVKEGTLLLVMGPANVEGKLVAWSGNTFQLWWPDMYDNVSNVTFTVPAGAPASKFVSKLMSEVNGGAFTRLAP